MNFTFLVIIFTLYNGVEQKPINNLLSFDDPVSLRRNDTIPMSVDQREEKYGEMGKKIEWKKTQEFHTVETKWEERHQEKTKESGGTKVLQVNKNFLSRLDCIIYSLTSLVVLVLTVVIILIIQVSLHKA